MENWRMLLRDTAETPKRLPFIDLARAAAIIVMVIIHTYSQMGSKAVGSSVLASAFNVLFSPFAAPVFMFLMGICMQLSTRLKFRDSLYRGTLLFCLAYVLNMARGWLPAKLGFDLGWYTLESMAPVTPGLHLIEIDILHFAGLAILLLSVIKKIIPWPPFWLLLSIAVLAAGPFLTVISSEHPVLRYVFSMLWGTQRHVCFPLFPWLFFPLAGMFYGSLLKKTDDIEAFFLKSMICGVLLTVFTIPVVFINNSGMDWKGWCDGEFRDGWLPRYIMVLFTGIHCIWLPACYIAAKNISSFDITKRLYGWSQQVTAFYFIQWIIIGWLLFFFSTLDWAGVIVCIAATLFLTDRTLFFVRMAQPVILPHTAHGVTGSP
jgi:uncharacterized membrane protein